MREASPPHEPAPPFLADAMLGRLARWLRVLGYDTSYDQVLDDPALVALADAEGRVLLTRDRHLVTHLSPHAALLLTTDRPLAQLREVVDALGLPAPTSLFTRCTLCNARLRIASADEMARDVLEKSRPLPGPFYRCPGCGRMYWQGSHVGRMQRTLATAFPEWKL